MALSTTEETIVSGTVGKVTYDLTFEGYVDNPPGYIKKAHIFLWINDVQMTVGGGGTEYDGSGITFVWNTATSVTIVGYSPVLDDKIEFRRTMPTDKPVVDFVDRAGITEAMLDDLALSNLYAVHEIKDGFGTGTQNYYALAKLYANADEDYEVEAGQYSSKHWSIKSSDYATAAGVSAAASEASKVLAVAAQGLAEDAQAAAEAAQAAAEAIDAYTKTEADVITDAIEAKADTNASDITAAEGRLTVNEADIDAIEAALPDKIEDEVQAWGYIQRSAPTTLSISTGAVAWNLSTASGYGKLTLTEDVTISLPTNLVDGAVFFMRIIQDSTGDWTVSYNASISFGDQDAPVMPTTLSTGEMILGFTTNGTKVECWEVWRSE